MQFSALLAALAVFTGVLAGPLRSLPQQVHARAAVQAGQDGDWGWSGGGGSGGAYYDHGKGH
ncbi:hypothetical protein MJO29_002492 [Puccinia striiformis f. sp. tritici]|uniref:Uncharacterized protein n=2 Tax=Puccinia striiformis TaxID=27350 RepID=A0A0L0VLV6_9BASI|nr:hypothetical protein Pst134EA_005621 [Puccinia striiformis f. sp. tritici]KAI9629056.1 hypothetical protein H4Q26_018339 [Puccinia striiformis f. sp. tritici PST-130]KNF00207.1 hypothetical protein PSTG_06620 [Puccinia striiformis f. sp. tritici PST-78]POW01579.1 hypothetical protein PSTT_12379 [Puccinia striiformis]KAH9471738.1 hypothetical protein Pst134EA_005621 [Puccinia striiformis f. sp. tritici]KAI7964394.1 hypothetical protein MJO29_002492 [Puccinia striiformis f. sp. tritici]